MRRRGCSPGPCDRASRPGRSPGDGVDLQGRAPASAQRIRDLSCHACASEAPPKEAGQACEIDCCSTLAAAE
eukprot:4387264-Alexandrium_andersonii.AAC.1